MQGKTDKQMWKKKHRIRESQTKVDNGVHPLHWLHLRVPLQWVPIQLISLKWYKNGYGINFSNCKQNAVQKYLRPILKITNWSSEGKENQ